MFFCEYCQIFKITCFDEHLQTAASVISSVAHYIELSWLVWNANRLIGFYMIDNTPKWSVFSIDLSKSLSFRLIITLVLWLNELESCLLCW